MSFQHTPKSSAFTLFLLKQKCNEWNIFWHFFESGIIPHQTLWWECTVFLGRACVNTHTLTHSHTLPHAEPHCDGEGSAGQLRINATWCKRPCAGFHTLANGRWSRHIPQEKEPQKEEICLLQLRLIVQFQLGISGPNYEDLGGPGEPRVRICEPYRKVTDTTLRMWGKASNAALIRLWLVSRQLKLADLSGMVRAGALSDSRLPLPFDWRGDFGRRLCRS